MYQRNIIGDLFGVVVRMRIIAVNFTLLAPLIGHIFCVVIPMDVDGDLFNSCMIPCGFVILLFFLFGSAKQKCGFCFFIFILFCFYILLCLIVRGQSVTLTFWFHR